MSYTGPMWEQSAYQDEQGRVPFNQWRKCFADKGAKARIDMSLLRMRGGNFGDCKPLEHGVWELHIDHGTGYRVYYARAGKHLILLLIGGDKRTQQVDIQIAVRYWQDWQARNKP